MSTIISNITNFEASLRKEKLSVDTIKNYLSDTNHFKAWAVKNNIKTFSKQNILRYISYLKMEKVSDSSINRRLATLRRLAKFLNTDFMSSIKNAGVTNKLTQQIDTFNENKQNLTASYIAIFVIMIIFIAASNYAYSRSNGTPINASTSPIIIGNKIYIDKSELGIIPLDPLVGNNDPITKIPASDQDLFFKLSANQANNNYSYLNDENFTTANVNQSLTGSIIIHAGDTQTTVYHPLITPDSHIIITPQGSTANNVLYISLVNDGIFMVNSDEPLPNDVRVNWIAN